MPKDIIDRRLAQMRGRGHRVPREHRRSGPSDVGALRADFDAVVLAVGALAPRELSTPGRELRGVHQAMTTCRRATGCRPATSTLPEIDAAGKHVDHHRRRRHRGRLPRHRQPAGRAVGDACSTTTRDRHARDGLVNPVWPSAPSTRGISPAHDEGVHEAWAREVGRVRRRRRRARCARSSSRRSRSSGSTGAASSARCRARGTSCPPTSCCSRPGSSAPTSRSCSPRSAWQRRPGRGTAVVDDGLADLAPRRLRLRRRDPRRIARRVGDRRGPGLRRRGRRRAHRRFRPAPAGRPARGRALTAPIADLTRGRRRPAHRPRTAASAAAADPRLRQRGQQQVGRAVAGIALQRPLGGDPGERAVAATPGGPAEQEQRRRVVRARQPRGRAPATDAGRPGGRRSTASQTGSRTG